MREWQPSEGAAFAALQAELGSADAVAAVAAADALPPAAFPPLFRDYTYEGRG